MTGLAVTESSPAILSQADASRDVVPEPHPEAVVLAETQPGLADATAMSTDRVLRSDGGRLAVNAAAGGASNLVKISLQLVMLPLMAHLLGPAEFGLYALALPTVAFFMALADGGLGTSLARERDDSPEVWSTAFWLLLGVGSTLALIVAGWGYALAFLAREPRLTGLMAMLSLSLVFLTSCVLPSARLTRSNRLFVISAADLSSAVIGATLAIVTAVSGWGAMSLAAQYAVGFFVRAVILNACAFVRPSAVFDIVAIREHLSTGSSLLGGRLCDFCGRLIENLVYGRVFGAAALGTYTFANQAPRFLCEAAAGPIWAALYAQALRENDERVAIIHARLVRVLSTAVFPLAFILSASAPEILGLLLGPRWSEASSLLRILIPFYALNVLASQSGAVLVAGGRGWLLFWATVFLTGARVLAVWAGSWGGQTGVAWGIGLALLSFAAFMFYAPSWGTRHGAWPLLRGLVPPLLAGLCGGAACFGLVHGHGRSLAWLASSLVAGCVAYAVALLLLDRRQIHDDLAAVRKLARRKQA